MNKDPTPSKARWFVSTLGACIVLAGLYVIVGKGIPMYHEPFLTIEAYAVSVFGIMLVIAGAWVAIVAWSRPSDKEG